MMEVTYQESGEIDQSQQRHNEEIQLPDQLAFETHLMVRAGERRQLKGGGGISFALQVSTLHLHNIFMKLFRLDFD
jgi:hypothetical protein